MLSLRNQVLRQEGVNSVLSGGEGETLLKKWGGWILLNKIDDEFYKKKN